MLSSLGWSLPLHILGIMLVTKTTLYFRWLMACSCRKRDASFPHSVSFTIIHLQCVHILAIDRSFSKISGITNLCLLILPVYTQTNYQLRLIFRVAGVVILHDKYLAYYICPAKCEQLIIIFLRTEVLRLFTWKVCACSC